MKKLLIAAMFIMISATSFGQIATPSFTPHIWNNTPQYSSGGYNKMVLNAVTNQMEYTPNTLLSGKVVAVVENDSALVYTHTGSFLTNIKYAVRDTVKLTNANYFSNQVFKFKVTASGADTTVFTTTSGNIDGSASYTMTGTNNSVTIYYDGTNYWTLK